MSLAEYFRKVSDNKEHTAKYLWEWTQECLQLHIHGIHLAKVFKLSKTNFLITICAPNKSSVVAILVFSLQIHVAVR